MKCFECQAYLVLYFAAAAATNQKRRSYSFDFLPPPISYSFSSQPPSIFKTDIIRSVCPHTDATEVDVDGINHLLNQIGYGHEILTPEEQDQLLDNINGHHAMRTLPVEDFVKLA